MSGSDYVFIAGIIFYFVVARAVAQQTIGFIAASVAFVFSYFLLTTIVGAINLLAYSAPISQLFGFVPIVTVIAQFLVILMCFYKMQANDEAYVEQLIWGAAGCIGMFFVIPYAVKSVALGF